MREERDILIKFLRHNINAFINSYIHSAITMSSFHPNTKLMLFAQKQLTQKVNMITIDLLFVCLFFCFFFNKDLLSLKYFCCLELNEDSVEQINSLVECPHLTIRQKMCILNSNFFLHIFILEPWHEHAILNIIHVFSTFLHRQ